MPEAITGYPKWERNFSNVPRSLIVAREEFLRIYRLRWTNYAFALFLALAVLRFVTAGRIDPVEQLLETMKVLEWGALAIIAIGAGPALLDDRRNGALELYYSRSVKPFSYVLGKGIAIASLASLAVFIPVMALYVSALFTVEDLPETWKWIWAGALGHSVLWGVVVTGIGLALSTILKTSRGATLVLLGVVIGLDIVVSNLLENLTRNDLFQLLSPLANLHQQNVWLVPGLEAPYSFPWWYSLIVLAGLGIAGWAITWIRRPRLKGVE